MLSIKNINTEYDVRDGLCEIINKLHEEGPVDSKVLESLTYYKIFHPIIFREYEEKILSVLGLFYKNIKPNDLFAFLLSGVGETHKKQYREYLTPVQASVRNAIEDQQFVSISAPTSAGKSFSLRDYIYEIEGDSVIVVPSRALIAEYIKTIRERFKNDKSVMISSFVDCVFKIRKLRRIFVLTPERARELFSENLNLNISLFFFDEAQVSEEKERGVIFDVLVRRVQKFFPNAKLIFAHPFVDNPSAQIKKHSMDEGKSYSRSYPHSTVGKAFIYGHTNKEDYYFSPYYESGHLIRNSIKLDEKFESVAFNGEMSVLVFVSKSSIYRGDFIKDFRKYVDKFNVVKDKNAVKIISQVEELLGANETNHRSNLVGLLRKGVVIHHGSVPLDVRFLIEDFIRAGFAKICFATSTLAQGINMPFDIVWLENMRMQGISEEDKALAFKNLIGRSGRLSKELKFDFGYVYTKNPKLLIERVNSSFSLSEISILDQEVDEVTDEKELISSILDGSFNNEFNLPMSKVERLSSQESIENIKLILELVYVGGFGEKLFGSNNKQNRGRLKDALFNVYCISLGRELFDGEKNVFNTAIDIFILVIQGRSFKEIVGIRYNNISRRGEARTSFARFSQPANKLPDSSLVNSFSLFKSDVRVKDVSYDAIVFDTYDYMDTVISFSLSDVLMGAFSIYHNFTKDNNALKMIELLKYGTNDTTHTLLLRYGFPPDEIKELTEYIDSITEDNIIFKPDVLNGSEQVKELVEWYLP